MKKRRPIAAGVLSTGNKDRSARGATIREKIEGGDGARQGSRGGGSGKSVPSRLV
jgi:hypothetical protein